MNSQLSLIADSLHIDGATLTKRGMIVDRGLDDDKLLAIGHRLFAIKGYSKWALGSLFTEMIKRRPDAKSLTGYDESWLVEFADTFQLDPKERRELVGVCMFYPLDKRTYELSYEHYREAMWGVNDGKPDQLSRALGFLDLAAQNGWTVTALRRHIRTTQAAPAVVEQADLGGYGIVFEFRRFVAREMANVSTLTPERARIILEDIGDDVLKYIATLQSVAVK